jgi:hypothetical protein
LARSHWIVAIILAAIVASVLLVRDARADTVVVTTVSELQTAVSQANSNGGNRIILVADGTYTLDTGLYISAPNVAIEGQSGNRASVTIEGDAMSDSASVGNVITVAADNFRLEHVTLQKSRNHLIQIRGETDADSPIIRNCILRDANEQIVKVSVNVNNTSVSSDNGLLENCLFEYTAGIGPQFYIGGIDAHSADDWVVRNNTFRNIISPGGSIAEYAIHFWNDSSGALVENNLIIDCDRGIGFGLNSRGNDGGTIRNNMIYHAANKGQFADTGISIHNSPNTKILNNTIFMEHGYPAAIEYRFSGTTNVTIANNLTNKSISDQNGASGSESSNVTNASSSWFVNVATGDLHLSSAVSQVVDQGQTIAGIDSDFDGDPRPQGSGIDIGADEYSSVAIVRPQAPTNLNAQ